MADLSSPQAYENPGTKGKAILETAMKAHGADRWDEIDSYEVKLEDEFFGGIGNFVNPHKVNPIEAQLNLKPRVFGGTM